jgi:hypothetical protein
MPGSLIGPPAPESPQEYHGSTNTPAMIAVPIARADASSPA